MSKTPKPLNRRKGSTWMVVTGAIVAIVLLVAFYSGSGGPSVSSVGPGGDTPQEGSRAPVPSGAVPASGSAPN